MVIVKHAKLLTMICRWCSRRLTYSLVRRSVLSYWSLCIVALVSAKMPGYVGPSCAVVDDSLYMHGYYIRRLSGDELQQFRDYQTAIEIHRQLSEAIAKGAASVSNNSTVLNRPALPQFCNGLDDSVEVVLDGCTVRNNHIYVADRFVRPLNRSEEMKIVEALFRMGNNGQMMRRRLRRHPHFDAAKEEDNAAEVVEEDLIDQSTASRLTDILARFLDVDAAVLRRFLPNENRTDELVAAAGREWAAIYRRVAAESRRNFTDTEKRSLTFTLLNEEESTTTISRARRLAGDQLVEEIEEGPLEHTPALDYVSPPSGTLNLNDPLLLRLLYSLAAQQQSVNQLVHLQQQQHQNSNYGNVDNFGGEMVFSRQLNNNNPFQQQALFPPNPSSAQPDPPPQQYTLPMTAAAMMRAGDRIIIGGQMYIAVPLDNLPPQPELLLLNNNNNQNTNNNNGQILGLMPAEVLNNYGNGVPQVHQLPRSIGFNGNVQQPLQYPSSSPEVPNNAQQPSSTPFEAAAQIRYGTGSVGVLPPTIGLPALSSAGLQSGEIHSQMAPNHGGPYNQVSENLMPRHVGESQPSLQSLLPHEICRNLEIPT